MISIQTNVNSLVAQQNLSVNSAFQSKTIAQLTSGYRINQSGDDAAGLAVANKFRSTISELTQGVANGNDATAQLQIMDGGMSNISQILDRLKTLATQSASGTFTGSRATLNSEFQTDLSEIDRQAQSIGLDTGGTFAKNLSVYLGQGSGSGDGAAGSAALTNASVSVDLSQATVDSGSLGLKGMKAITGTIAAGGTDIGTGSSNGTTVADIVNTQAGNAQAKAGYATFILAGPGFSDNSKISIQANLSGVGDVNSLVTAINTAISNAASGSTQPDQALKGAGITATVNTDQYGHQQLAFNSSTTAFQVQAGDQMANALMGNFATPGSATGKAVTSSVTGLAAGNPTAAFTPTNVSVQIAGAGLAGPVNISLLSADSKVSDATSDVVNQVNHNAQLQNAGITAALTSDNKLQFTSATGATFSVSSVGDAANALGLGTFVTNSALNGAASYSDISAGVSLATAATGNGVATLGISLNGGVTGGVTPATITATAGTGYNGGATPNGTVNNAAGALGSMTLTLNGSSSPVTVNFALDANQGATETVQQAASFINSQIQAQAGYGSDVKLATVTSGNTLALAGPADGAGTISATGAAATALGLTAAAGANVVAASGSVGNTVSVNLAAGDATGAVATGSAAPAANIATGTNTMALSIDGTTVNANFANDGNAAGTVATLTSSTLGASNTSTLDVSALQGGTASLAGGVVGGAGVNGTLAVDLGTYAAKKATTTGANLTGTSGTDVSSVLNLDSFKATSAATVSGSLGAGTGLSFSTFAPQVATVTGGAIGTSPASLVGAGQAIDVTQFAAAKATTTGTTSLAGTLNFGAFNAQAATLTSTITAASNTATITGLASLDTSAGNELNITVSDGSTPHTHAIDIHGATNLDGIVNAINTDGTIGTTNYVHAADTNGVLTISTGSGFPGGATGAQNSISVVSNAASQLLGLATSGQIGNSTAQGANATGLQLTVDTAAKSAQVVGTAALGTGNLHSILSTYAATQAVLVSGQVAPTDGTSNPDVAALADVDADHLKITVDGTMTAVNLHGAASLDDVVSKITLAGIANLSATDSGGVLTLTNTAAAGVGHNISVASNNASQALSLSSTEVDSKAFVGVNVTVDGVAAQNVDISSCTDANSIAAAIGGAVHTANAAYTAANVASASSTGVLTITGVTANPTGRVNIVHNALTDYLGLTNSSSDTHATGAFAGNTTVNVDLTGLNSKANVAAAINNAVTAVNHSAGTVATLTGTGNNYLTLTGASASAAGTVNIANNALSNYLGLTTGSAASNNSGKDTQMLTLNVDGGGAKNVDISGAHSLSDIVGDINTAVGGAPASATNGNLVIAGTVAGHTGSVNITDNAVSRALKLTTSADVNQSGTDATKLLLNIDGLGQVGVDVSGCTNVLGVAGTGLTATINQAISGASGYGAYSGGLVTSTTDGGGHATLTFTSVATGAAGSSVQIVNNAVSQALHLTAGTTTGTDSTKLNLNVDGLGQVAVDLSTLGHTGTLSQMAAAINTAVAAAGHGYNGTYDSVASAHAGTGSTGYIALSGVTVGGSLSVTNNGMSNALGLTTGSSDTVVSGAAKTLNVQLDGKAQLAIDVSSLGNNAKMSDIAAKINQALVADSAVYGAAYSHAATANLDGSLTVSGVAGGGSVLVTNSTVSNTLGLTANSANGTATGAAVQTLGVSLDGKTTDQVSFAGITGGGTPTLSAIAAKINAALVADTTNYGAAYANAVTANSNGTLTVNSVDKGATAGQLAITNNVAGRALGLTSGSAGSVTASGTNETLAQVVSFLNTSAQQALGTSNTANIVTLNGNGAVNIASQTKGANSSVAVLSSGTTGGLAAALNLSGYVDNATTGTARSTDSVVAALKQAFNSNTTLQEAGLTALANPGTGNLEIKSNNGTQFRLDAWGTKTSTTDSDLGFGDTGKAFTNSLTAAQATSSVVDAQGAAAIGTFANGTGNTASISFQAMQFGNDNQSISISASSNAGVAQTPLTITLQNNGTAQTGASIDAAISAINTSLQQSDNATLRSITAVQETAANGAESINFISSLSSFNVAVSSSAGAAVGDGLNGGVAKTFTSTMNGASSSIAIDTQAGAAQAVAAIASAVTKLGGAQAAIGRGENQLGYAINLAQSQITNFSAAESQIRDTNVAQQAANLSKAQVLSQASIAAMAQANSAPQAVLSLLRG